MEILKRESEQRQKQLNDLKVRDELEQLRPARKEDRRRGELLDEKMNEVQPAAPAPAPKAWSPDDGARQELLRRQMEQREKDRLKQTNEALAAMGERQIGAKTASEKLTDGLKAGKDAAEQHGAGFAALDPMAAARAAKQGAVAGAGAIGTAIGGPGAGAAAGSAVDLVLTRLMVFAEGFNQAVEKFAEVNGKIGEARAMADAMQTMGDIRRAVMLENELSQMSLAQSKLSQVTQDALAALMKPIIPLITDGIERLIKWADAWGYKAMTDDAENEIKGYHQRLRRIEEDINKGWWPGGPGAPGPGGAWRNPLG